MNTNMPREAGSRFAGNKIRVFLFLFLATYFLAFSHAAYAKSAQERCQDFAKMFRITNSNINIVSDLPQYCTFGGLIMTAVNIALAFAGTVAVLFIIIGGFWYMTSSGDEEQAEKGRKTLVNAVIGLVVIIMSFAIVRIVNNTLTGGTGGSNNTPSTDNQNNNNNSSNSSNINLLDAITFPGSITPGNTALVVFSLKTSSQEELAAGQKAISDACSGGAFNNATFNISINGTKAGTSKFTANNSGISAGVSVSIPSGQTQTELVADICGNIIANSIY